MNALASLRGEQSRFDCAQLLAKVMSLWLDFSSACTREKSGKKEKRFLIVSLTFMYFISVTSRYIRPQLNLVVAQESHSAGRRPYSLVCL